MAQGGGGGREGKPLQTAVCGISLLRGEDSCFGAARGRIPCLPGGQRASNQIIKLSKSLIVRARILTRGISVRILDPVMSAQLADGEPMGACKVRHFKGG